MAEVNWAWRPGPALSHRVPRARGRPQHRPARRQCGLFCSTSTLEHIPADDILAILRECRRVASSQALFSFIIDYHDHYGTADKQIGRFHFYRYSDREWRKFNPSNHYQNRLRHSDYEKLFERSGLSSLQNKRIFPDWTGPDLKRATVSPSFKHYSHDDLVAANGHFLLSKIVSAPLA